MADWDDWVTGGREHYDPVEASKMDWIPLNYHRRKRRRAILTGVAWLAVTQVLAWAEWWWPW